MKKVLKVILGITVVCAIATIIEAINSDDEYYDARDWDNYYY